MSNNRKSGKDIESETDEVRSADEDSFASNDEPQAPDEESDSEDVPLALAADDAAEPAIEQPPVAARRRAGSPLTTIIGYLALIIAVTALLGVAYLATSGADDERATATVEADVRRLAESLDSVRSSIEVSRGNLQELQDRLARLADSDAARGRSVTALQDLLTERLEGVGALSGRLGNLEATMSSLRGITSGVRDTWLLREAEYYMQIANAQLQLAGNPEIAILALRLADERVFQLANPALTEVRRALSDELRALETMETPDLEGIALTLASLATVVDSLPMREALEPVEGAVEELDPELSGMDRALASLRRTLGDVVSVRRTDESAQPLIAPESQFFLRANLSLQLQAARLALLRNEQVIFEQSLDDASAWLNDYYNTENTGVRSALATIAELRMSSFNVNLPDISGSLTLLRQFEILSSASAGEDEDIEPDAADEPPQ